MFRSYKLRKRASTAANSKYQRQINTTRPKSFLSSTTTQRLYCEQRPEKKLYTLRGQFLLYSRLNVYMHTYNTMFDPIHTLEVNSSPS